MDRLFRSFCITYLLGAFSLAAYAKCDCPAPRPMHATATSGVVTLEYEEEFKAKQQIPSRIEIIIQADRNLGGTSIVGHINDMVRRLEEQLQQQFRANGITAAVNVQVVDNTVADLSAGGFKFLNSVSGPDGNGETLTLNAYGRPVYENNLPPEPGVFKAQVQIRASVCVEANDTYLTFEPKHRRRMVPVLPDDANIPDHILEQKKAEFAKKVQQEIDRIKAELSNAHKQLTEQQRFAIREASTDMFEVSVPITFFGRNYQFPVRVTPLKQVRICSNTIGE